MFKETITYLALYIKKVVCKMHLLIFLLSDTVFTLKNAHSLHLTFIFAHLCLNSSQSLSGGSCSCEACLPLHASPQEMDKWQFGKHPEQKEVIKKGKTLTTFWNCS